MRLPHSNSGFSLVELSIVLVILGLLVGGVLSGQNLIRAAELRSISGEAAQFQSAFYQFVGKYNAKPGDFKDATKFWGAMATCPPPSGSPIPAPSKATCDGNGDGNIGNGGDGYTNASRNEWLYVWQHLSNAGVVSGQFGGVGTTVDRGVHEPGVNCPRSKADSAACWGIKYIPEDGSFGGHRNYVLQNGRYFPGNEGNALELGSIYYAAPVFSILTPEEMWNIDMKMDDGQPDSGILLSQLKQMIFIGGAPPQPDSPCYTDVGGGELEYNVGLDAVECSLVFHYGL